MKKILFSLLTLVLLYSCNNTNSSIPNDSVGLKERDFVAFQDKMDSIAIKQTSYTNEEIVFGLRFGEKRDQVNTKMFDCLERGEIGYNAKKFFIVLEYNNTEYQYTIDFSYSDDILFEISFRCDNIDYEDSDFYNSKMALFEYFKKEMEGCKLLRAEGRFYNDALQYKGTIGYIISDNNMYIRDIKLSNTLLKIDSIQACADILMNE